MRPTVRPFIVLITETTWLLIYIKAGTGAQQGGFSMQLKVYLPFFQNKRVIR